MKTIQERIDKWKYEIRHSKEEIMKLQTKITAMEDFVYELQDIQDEQKQDVKNILTNA